jgi:drug/metabolite transporter (DMT)-like permease
MTDRRLLRATAAAGVVLLSFAAIFVVKADVSATTTTVFRALYAIPLLLVVWLAVRRRDERPGSARRLAIVAGLVLSFDLTFFHLSIEWIGAGLATVLVNTQVLFVGFIAWIVYRERPTRTAFWMVPVMLVGVALISGLGAADSFGDDPARGVLAGLLAGAAYGGFLLIFRASNRSHLAPVPGPVLDATIGVALGGLVAGAIAGNLDVEPSWPAHGWLLALAILVQAVGWMLVAVALPRLAALETSVIILIQPVGALLWSRLFLDEQLGTAQAIGALLVIGGLVLLSIRGTVEAPPAAEPVAATRTDAREPEAGEA